MIEIPAAPGNELTCHECQEPLVGVAPRCARCHRPACVECGEPATEDRERRCAPCALEALEHSCWVCGDPEYCEDAGVCWAHVELEDEDL